MAGVGEGPAGSRVLDYNQNTVAVESLIKCPGIAVRKSCVTGALEPDCTHVYQVSRLSTSIVIHFGHIEHNIIGRGGCIKSGAADTALSRNREVKRTRTVDSNLALGRNFPHDIYILRGSGVAQSGLSRYGH